MAPPLIEGTLGHVAVVALTQLGDVWWVAALILGVHWRGPRWLRDRRASALLVATSLLAVTSVIAAKTVIAAPRPPVAASTVPPSWLPDALTGTFRAAATADGFGFPSGHAVLATTVYGGLAAVATRYRGGQRGRLGAWLGAGVLITTVAASRVALGVHYPRDVIAGVGLGAVVLAVGMRVDDPQKILGLAGFLALGTLVATTTGAGTAHLLDTAGMLGACAGGVVAVRWREVSEPPPSPAVFLGGTLLAGAVLAVGLAGESLLLVAVSSGLAVYLAILGPSTVGCNGSRH